MKIYIYLITLFISSIAGAAEKAIDCEGLYKEITEIYKKYIKDTGNDYELRQQSMGGLAIMFTEPAYKCQKHSKTMVLMATLNIEAFENNVALEYAKAAVSADRNSAEANQMLGSILCMFYRFDIGLPYIEKAVNIEPNNNSYIFSLCSNYEMAKLYEKAIEACDTAIELAEKEKTKAAAIYVKARAYKGMGNQKEAEKHFALSKKYGYNGDQYYTDEHLGKKSNKANQH